MDNHEKKSVKNPRKDANPISIWTFKWLLGTFLTGYKRELEISDLYPPLDEHSSKLLGDKVTHLWNQELERYEKLKKTPSLIRVLMKCFGKDIALFGLGLAFVEFFIKIPRPIILANLLRYFRGNHIMEITEAYCWGTALVLGMFLDILIFHNSFQGLRHIGMKIRVACCSLVYRKILKVPVTSENKSSIGQMFNFLSNDAGKLDLSVMETHYIWIAPIQVIFISFLLYKEVEVATFGGIAITLLFILIHGFHGKLIHHFTSHLSYVTDERLRLTNQIICSIKAIKMYTWEKAFAYLNDKVRKKEVKIIRNNTMTSEINISYKDYIPRVCVCATILVYVLLGNHIKVELVYLVMAYYNVLRFSFYDCFPIAMKDFVKATVTLKRLKQFLLSEEIKEKQFYQNNIVNIKTTDKISLSFNNVTAQWNSEFKREALKQISFQLQSGSLTAIIGQVGAGKTVLFQAILQEISDIQGEIKINGRLSYACQEPWLFTSSIKQNILFGKPMDKERYEKVIEACQLKRDFLLLPYGENTLIGDKGINLSGGQCARINLARAVYHEAEIYLLDDPLSAVDAQVGKSIFEDCIKTFLKGKTVVLITHQFQFLKQVDRIIVLDHGNILANGTYIDLLDSGLNLTKMMQLENESDEIGNKGRSPAKEDKEIITTATLSITEEEKSEDRTRDSIKWETYLKYFKAAKSGWLVFLVILISAICQISRSGADYFISYWLSIEEKVGNFTFSSDNDFIRDRNWYIIVYCSIIGFTILFALVQSYTFCHMCKRISRNLHSAMFTSIIKTKMVFFNSNPIGRILNRFSRDMGIVDTEVPIAISEITITTLQTLAIVGIVVKVYPLFFIAALIITAVAYLFSCFCIKTIRTIQRLDGIIIIFVQFKIWMKKVPTQNPVEEGLNLEPARSPIFNHLSTSARGLTTIRALNAQQISMNEFDNRQDLNSSAWFIFISGSRGFGMYIDFLCLVFTGIVTYTILRLTDIVTIADAGLAISQCTLMTQMIQMSVRKITELESMMTSVERILEYSNLEQEPLLDRSSANKVLESWPERGQIMFKDVSLIYDLQMKPFLRNLHFTIKPNEMIGIVGRTGAGKSSLINALFRISKIEGEIYIDNVATSKIALQDLRSKISIIPQEPVLFAGTLRTNLDPFNVYMDQVLCQALEDVQLKALLLSSVDLNMRVAEGGMNFSVGQRQLLCLARAIVKNNKILVLDEATANVDPQTDQLIQKTIRKKFANCTVLIIAHRLHTVMDSSRILVMDAGQIVEFDHPYNLLQQSNGAFRNMVQQMGATTAENLFQIAKHNYEDNRRHEASQYAI